MGKPLAITRIEHLAEDLRAIASKSRDGAQVRRLLALAAVLDGQSRYWLRVFPAFGFA